MKKYALLLGLFTSGGLLAQIGIGQWRDHLPYKQGFAVAEGPEKVYVGTESAVFEYSKLDNAEHRLSKVNGLSDIGVSALNLNSYNNVLVIGYTNGNLDLLENNTFYNVSDIKRSSVIGSKRINSIYFNGRYAYLSCGFGIIYFDTEKKEVKDTYYIGFNGGHINVNSITISNNVIYAASDSGLYSASLSAPNLADFSAWSRITDIPRAIYNAVCTFNSNVIANLSVYSSDPTQQNKDTLYYFNGTSWDYFPPDTTGFIVHSLTPTNGRLAVVHNGFYRMYNSSFSVQEQVGSFQANYWVEPRQVVMNSAGDMWAADHAWGLIKFSCQGWCNQRICPDGPKTEKVYAIDIKESVMWVAPGQRTSLWDNQYNSDGIFYYKDNTWGAFDLLNTPSMTSVRDIVSVTIDPNNTDHVYVGSIGEGLMEFNSSGLVTIWDESNSSLQVRNDAPTSGSVQVFGSAFDEDGNLWVSNSKASDLISVRKADGTWQSFNMGSVASAVTAGSIIVTSIKQKWVILPRGGGLVVFNENGTWSTGDDSYVRLGFQSGSGGLPGTEVISIAEDKDGEIWVGTDKGIAVYYTPDNIFASTPPDAQQILIEQDGHTQILLETEEVTAIAIDGANRKWLGTQNSGVFLMSADGTQQIHHFDETNSPLFSNTITSISIDGATGEVFFGTAKGIISYKGTATEGSEEFTDVYAYPNPVRPGYGGPIAIKGLVKDCDVKITDITGTLIYQTTALGGQAVWDGKNFNGDRAHSGVYLVFCSNDDGSKTYVTKICIVN